MKRILSILAFTAMIVGALFVGRAFAQQTPIVSHIDALLNQLLTQQGGIR